MASPVPASRRSPPPVVKCYTAPVTVSAPELRFRTDDRSEEDVAGAALRRSGEFAPPDTARHYAPELRLEPVHVDLQLRLDIDAERLDVPLELKLQSWHRHEELHRRRGFRVAWLWVFALSVAATLVSFTGWFNLRVAVALVLVVALHEGGHYLAMRATGYQDVRVYLLPFLGGATENWFAYMLALFFLLFRPQGLFGEKIIERV